MGSRRTGLEFRCNAGKPSRLRAHHA
jgi:hypothetical protein